MKSLFIVSFIIVHIFLGRKASIPYGILIGKSIFLIIGLAFLLDMLQIEIWRYVFDSVLKINIAKKVKERFHKYHQKLARKNKFFSHLKKAGNMGVIFISAVPWSGFGVWSGVFFSRTIKNNMFKTYVLVGLGSLIGCVILALGTEAFKNILKIIF